ncbi:uncharacterized protein LOC127246010 isoform X2 [Andrographis paniculata]|uniref:uncharacterized protein LOC127246010 isoform X2 n=1 Tax=Andrographis paniculata TaxID=175694 RepID=UPI0021E81E54|nr:uncharacterized protein LOC127246010 isoform X2 [Andrographis paniculata]
MEYPWGPRPPHGNFCPVCSNSHFPFCPAPPPPQYFRPPPPPPDQFYHMPPPPPPPPQPPYDPFVDHQGGPPVNPYPPPRPWNGNTNFSSNYYGNSYPDYDQNGHVGGKRMRFDSANESYTCAASEDERRLKLIHDHGFMNHGLDKNLDGGYRHSNHSLETSNLGENNGNFGDRPAISSSNKILKRSPYPEAMKYENVAYQDQQRNFSVGSRDNQFMQPKLGYYGLPNHSDNVHPVQVSPGFNSHSPIPMNQPPPTPAPPRFRFPEPYVDSASSLRPQSTLVSEGITSVSGHYSSQVALNGFFSKDTQSMKIASAKTLNGERDEFSSRHLPLDKPRIIDASHILKHPHRANRPDHMVIILRGLPGSGKSYLAKLLRDLEVENGGTAPRIHSMDEYFMTEVEKVEETEGSKSSGSSRGKKTTTKKVMEYCYEPEMEEAYRSSMLKAFKKTLDEGNFPFVIVDDRNLRVADFAQFWATAKRSGYEVYLVEATYKDPAGCAARNVHDFTQNDIQDMANQWEEAPSMYMKLDIKSLIHGDDLEENGIQEVDMDMDDGNHIADSSGPEDANNETVARPSGGFSSNDDQLKDEQSGDASEIHTVEEVKELGKSKWSNDLDDDDAHKTDGTVEDPGALPNLIKSYSKKGKSVRWADKVGSSIGFSIGSGKSGVVSLIIGPGPGYNSKANPPPEDEKLSKRQGERRNRNVLQEQLRAEGEAFKAVFDKRRHRIGGLDHIQGADDVE